MTAPHDTPAPAGQLNRRQLLVASGATISLGAVLTACGGSSSAEGEPGRVGYAPVPTALPTEVVDDSVYLRTAQSIEYTILEVYGTITDSGALSGSDADLLARLIEEHTAAAALVGDVVTESGGEPYECANSWYMERVVPEIFEHIDGDEDAGIPPSDDPARDMLAVMDGMESMATSMYQGLVQRLSVPELRAQVVEIGARTARHSATVAIASTGAPNAYISPAVRGEEVAPNDSGLIPLYAIPAQFGTLNAYQLTIGAPSSAGTRFTLPLETPADNSYVYTGMTCPT